VLIWYTRGKQQKIKIIINREIKSHFLIPVTLEHM